MLGTQYQLLLAIGYNTSFMKKKKGFLLKQSYLPTENMNFINMNFLLSLNLNIFNRKVISDKPENKHYFVFLGSSPNFWNYNNTCMCQILF